MASNGDGVYRYLVRYGIPGYVGRFGTIQAFDILRGAQVVVATDRGLEIGEVLIGPESQASDARLHPPAGELVRPMNDEDRRRAYDLRQAHLPYLEHCQQLLAERDADVVVVDGEMLLDGQRVILYFLGVADEQLGPWAVELGRKAGGAHVQFQSLDPRPSTENAPDSATGESESPPAQALASPLARQEIVKSQAEKRWPAVAQILADPTMPALSRDDAFLLQIHGLYQQRDRDAQRRRELPLAPCDDPPPAARHSFMVRTRPPGGRLTAEQMLAHLELADRFAEGALRITSRQGLQLHRVAKSNLAAVVRQIDASLLTTLGACGDVSRNVVCCPAPVRGDRVRLRLQSLAAEIARHFTPRCRSYYEIWLDEAPWPSAPAEADPVYGDAYLPRKFKVGLALPDDNCTEVFSQDLGLLAIVEEGRIAGFNVLVGGGLGASPTRADTFPRLADPLAFVPAGEALRTLDAIVQIYRLHGNRQDRRRARLKYLVEDWGIARLKTVVEEFLQHELAPPRSVTITGVDDHLGWRPQGDGRLFLGVSVPSGRIADTADCRLKTALATVLRGFRFPVRLTPQQNLILCDIAPDHRAEVERRLADLGVARVEDLSPLRRYALACPALPTCGLAVAEAERLLPFLLQQLEEEASRLELERLPFSLRIAGCSNACSRTPTAEIALVGRARGRYAIYLGGDPTGQRLNFLYRDDVPQERLAQELIGVLAAYRDESTTGEAVGDFFLRRYSPCALLPCVADHLRAGATAERPT